VKFLKYPTVLFGVALFILACTDPVEIDTEKPSIDISFVDAFPAHCSDTLYFGEAFTLQVRFLDNAELGSYSVDVHHNFDHHSHSTSFMECELDPVKSPVNPYTSIQDFDLPEGQTEFETDQLITIPASDSHGAFDEGDYHFSINLVDKEGWSTMLGLGIRMAYRQ